MHPLSVGELIRADVPMRELAEPAPIPDAQFAALWEHGGYPEPFLLRDASFTRRWHDLRRQQLVREDVRDMTRIHELDQLDVLVELLLERSASHLVYSNLARDVNVSVDTIRRWVAALSALYFGFIVRPWYRNVGKSLRKEPKWYCLDWSSLVDTGQRLETLVACHLLKAVQCWQA
jgi:predicted AAA+ superfamily ATPase